MSSKAWITVSVLLNAVLSVALLRSTLHRHEMPLPAAPVDSVEQAAGSIEPKAPVTAAFKPQSGPTGMKQWIDLLRNAGAPAQLLATVVQTDFDRRWQKQANDLRQKYLNNEAGIDDIALSDSQHDVELEKEMKDALGDDAFRAWDQARQFSDINVEGLGLTQAQTDSLYQLRKHLEQQLHDLEVAKTKKEIDQAQYDSRREAADADYQSQLRLLLGYQRYNQVKGSGIPADVQHVLKAMNVGEDQLTSVENLEHEWHDRQNELQEKVDAGQLDQAGFEQQMQALQGWHQQQMLGTLGTNAFEYLQKQQDQRYVDMKSYAPRWGLGDQDIEQVYSTLNTYDRTVQNYKQQINVCESSGDTAREDQIKQALQSFSNQTSQSLQQYLGQERFNLLKSNHILPFN